MNDQRDKKSCSKCGRSRGGDCMAASYGCYGCGKSGHMIRDCPHVKNQYKGDTQPRCNPNAAAVPPKRNRFYAIKVIEEKEKLADVVIGKFLVFCFPFYAFLDQVSTFSFITSLISSKFDLQPEILHEPF